MKKNISAYSFVLILCSLLFYYSCKKDKPASAQIDFGYTYFPGGVGSYIVYQVDSIHYDDAGGFPHDTTQYLLKEVLASSFLDNSNRPTLRVERYKKWFNDTIPYDSMQWVLTDVWTETKTTTTLEKKEENLIYIKLVFPATKGKKWDGNSYNTLGHRDYEIMDADKPETVNALNFDSVVTVKQFQQINIIEKRYEAEKFARNVGLIYKEQDSLYLGQFPDTNGYTYTQKIVSYVK